jgi:hypothetical protein
MISPIDGGLFSQRPESRFMTGTYMVVDGGLLIGPRHSWDENAPGDVFDSLEAFVASAPGMTIPSDGRVPFRVKFFHGFGSRLWREGERLFDIPAAVLQSGDRDGCPAGRVLALAIAMVVDAFADPIIGHMSDKTYSRWGRRHALALPCRSVRWRPAGCCFGIRRGWRGRQAFTAICS